MGVGRSDESAVTAKLELAITGPRPAEIAVLAEPLDDGELDISLTDGMNVKDVAAAGVAVGVAEFALVVTVEVEPSRNVNDVPLPETPEAAEDVLVAEAAPTDDCPVNVIAESGLTLGVLTADPEGAATFTKRGGNANELAAGVGDTSEVVADAIPVLEANAFVGKLLFVVTAIEMTDGAGIVVMAVLDK